jgi:tetratricopeptide (TPR) repeat protein
MIELASALIRAKRIEEAKGYLLAAIADLERLGERNGLDEAYFDIGDIYFVTRQYESALNMYRASIDQVAKDGMGPFGASIYERRAEVFEKLGQVDAARSDYHRAETAYRVLGYQFMIPGVKRKLDRLPKPVAIPSTESEAISVSPEVPTVQDVAEIPVAAPD